ncbi:PepSY domain-containing protein [Citricoccus alkalitolerans]|uniref:PepSY domain-containing protein n=1 Tax=Citricoccus alkalitolerans TaxID=246603 RepID=A0ABV8XYG5_9MICC
MMQNKGATKVPQSTFTQTLAWTGTGILALALLTGCSVAEPDNSDDTATTATPGAAAETSDTTGDGTDEATGGQSASAAASATDASTSTSGGTTAAVAGEDPVFAAIDAFLAEQEGALIVEIDLDDNDTRYDIEAVVGDQILDFDVTLDGEVREDTDDDDDQDDIRRAQEADITAEEAARAALEGREGSTIDSLSLDDDDNALRWEVELDNAQGEDDDLHVDAMTGEVTTDN